jgi:hypothetical protein
MHAVSKSIIVTARELATRIRVRNRILFGGSPHQYRGHEFEVDSRKPLGPFGTRLAGAGPPGSDYSLVPGVQIVGQGPVFGNCDK